jgi:membrane dipeptidase
VGRNPDDIAICTTAAQAESIIESGRIAAFIGIENGVAIENSLDNLEHFYNRGVRYLTLTHVASSEWCISSGDTLPAFHGLTDFGRDVVRKMNELGMIVDISHASVSALGDCGQRWHDRHQFLRRLPGAGEPMVGDSGFNIRCPQGRD